MDPIEKVTSSMELRTLIERFRRWEITRDEFIADFHSLLDQAEDDELARAKEESKLLEGDLILDREIEDEHALEMGI